ncbi:M13 family metallopeptidase [Steroidobacter agaridevorans]|uniref:M13 family metallopeptidase n=1 Tax=Steroidobacter agaridevorans TaxID=2695856 RepID=UPI00132B9DA0|nr:M13 family metallopeptidase [Steroidobacter agaridevorans]GFE90286.1 metallopeptidase [Steroidobacter agaridevorans]
MKWSSAVGILVLIAGSAYAAEGGPQGVQLGDIDRKAEPCNDFFAYANGAWRAQNPIPASMPRWSRRWAAGEANKDRLKIILEAAAATKAQQGSIDQLTGDFYASCMDEARIDRLGIEPLKPQLTEIASIRDNAGVQREIQRLHAMNVSMPFNVYGWSDDRNPNDVIVQIDASGLGLPDRDYYFKKEPRFEEARAKYLEHVQKMFELAGHTAGDAKVAARTVMRMETSLAQHSLDNVALRDPKSTDHKMTFAQLQQLTPHFDWQQYYSTSQLPRGELNVAEPEFMKEVDRQLAATPLADWKTYLTWHLLHSAAPSLSKPFVQEHFAFNSAYLEGAKEMKPRWKQCAESADALLGEAVGKIYVEKYFPPQAKARVQEMVQNLRLAMGETIEGLQWMTPATKQRALEKLATFNPKVGYPDKWLDYSAVPISRDSYWNNVIAGRQFNIRDNWSTIGKPLDRGRWGMTPPTSDAYYSPALNEIVFPAGILQPPAFDLAASDAVNYGAIGVVIGHEISHGFDDQGAQYDAQGRLHNWWSDADLKAFQTRTACVVKQFDGYFIEPGIHHNGRLVLGESIGDLAGARIAYRALEISRRGKPPLPTIDGFTPEQQFFIAWGQFRGDEIRPEFARSMVQGDPHPIAKYRVIGPLSNLPEFQQAFQCKADAPMVRAAEQRCEVW